LLSVLIESWLSAYTDLGEGGILKNSLKGATRAMAEAKVGPSIRKRRRIAQEAADDKETLNFKVMTAFKKEFKGYAVSQGMTMVELLKEGFELSKQKRRQRSNP
jgi:hypothetical protein